MNICDSLPKSLKKMKFIVEAVPEDIFSSNDSSNKENNVVDNSQVILKQGYETSDEIKDWIEKFSVCEEIIEEARKRKEELVTELSNIDKEFSNIIHIIELEGSKDLYHGWLEYKEIKKNREKRRKIKDEYMFISSVLDIKMGNFNDKRVEKIKKWLANRKFTLRVIEENEEDESEEESIKERV
jgi:hypothetical protein